MSILHRSTLALRKLSLKSKTGAKNYTQVSQPVYKLGQPAGVAQAQTKSDGWALPALLVLLGLSFSTFSTHQLVSGKDSIKRIPYSSKD